VLAFYTYLLLRLSGSFSWGEHIAESGDRPAPKTCFRQVCKI